MRYHVTGVDVYGRRFKLVYTRLMHARMINLHRGSIWQVDRRGRRKLIERVGW